jgi:hypothetical protein
VKANPYVWNYGDFVAKNLSTGDEINIHLKNKGWVSKKDFTIRGQLTNKDGEVK